MHLHMIVTTTPRWGPVYVLSHSNKLYTRGATNFLFKPRSKTGRQNTWTTSNVAHVVYRLRYFGVETFKIDNVLDTVLQGSKIVIQT